jgi:hypothetical protein
MLTRAGLRETCTLTFIWTNSKFLTTVSYYIRLMTAILSVTLPPNAITDLGISTLHVAKVHQARRNVSRTFRMVDLVFLCLAL